MCVCVCMCIQGETHILAGGNSYISKGVPQVTELPVIFSSAGLGFAAVLPVLVPGAGGPPGKTGGPPGTKAAGLAVLIWFSYYYDCYSARRTQATHARKQHTHAQESCAYAHTASKSSRLAVASALERWTARHFGHTRTHAQHSSSLLLALRAGHDDLELRIEPCMAARRSADSPNHATRLPPVSNPAG